MSRQSRQQAEQRKRRRTVAFVVGASGFGLMLLAIQVLTLAGTVAVVGGWVLLVWGLGAVLWAARETWETRVQ